jgi:flagellar basal-body rod modification protein FlgD
MTTVNPISNTGALSAADAAKASAAAQAAQGLGKDAFLKLLITQLQNQDPLNPADSTEFTAQLAQFSSLEQLSNINENIKTLELYQASINNAQAVSFIGKEIVAKGDKLEVTSGQPRACEFELGASAKKVVVSIYDAAGNFIRDLTAASMGSGKQSLTWDGRDLNGNTVPSGIYTFGVQAEGADGEKVSTTTFLTGTVSGVTFRDGITYLTVGGSEVSVGDVTRIRQGAESSAAS